MPGRSAQAKDITSDAAAASTVADVARLLRELRRRYARQQRDSPLTYRELAAKTGWSQAAIAEYFSGRTLPPIDRLDALAVLLGANPAELGALGTARDRVEERRRAAAPPSGPATPAVRQLPRDVSGFVGRAGELARLDALLDQDSRLPAVVISAVSGTAGVGKTALAVHWAHRIAHRFPDGQLYVNLRGFDPGGPPMASAEAVRRFLDALQVSPQRIPVELDAQAALYRSLLAGRKLLILLDNAREPEHVRPLLPGAADCLVLVTSRDQMSGLVAADGAHPLALDLLTDAEAGDLLTERLGPERIAAEPAAVEQIITACAGLPLALAIVAARAATQHQLPLAALAGDLHDRQDRLDALSTGDPTTDVRVVFSCSYHALTLDAARLFRLLSLHSGPDISAPAAASLAGLPPPQVLPLLAELIRASLLVEHTAGRYTLHDLLHAYATHLTDTTDPDDELTAATYRLLDHYLHSAYTAARLLAPARDPVRLTPPQPGVTPEEPADHAHALAWFTAEHPVLLAAVDHAVAGGFDTHTWQLAWTAYDFLGRRGHWHDLAATGRAAVAAAGRLADPTAQARAHRHLAQAYIHVGRIDDAHTQLRHALDLHRRAGDPVGQAHTHHALTQVWELQDRYDAALDHARQALDLHQAAGHRRGQANALNAIGWCHTRLGDHQQALTHCQQALTLHQEHGDRVGMAATWDSLGYAHHHLGHDTRAIASYQHAIDLYRDLGDRYNEAATLTRLGDTHHDVGNLHAARAAWHHALTILTDLDHPDADRLHTRLAGLDVNPVGDATDPPPTR
jgi:tetratricopeptide (TPR) repeat protein